MSLCSIGLSCEPINDLHRSNETLSICIHGYPLKFGNCHSCEIEHRFILIESKMNEMFKMIEGHQKQINDVIKLFVKGDSVLEDDIIRIERKIEKLEEIISEKYDHSFVISRIERLEKQITNHYEMLQNNGCDLAKLMNVGHEKRPHKCPVCDGYGVVLTGLAKVDFDATLLANLNTHKTCNSCEGKGIVWS